MELKAHLNETLQPELHYFDGLWYIYYTAGTSANLDLQRPHVLKGVICLYTPPQRRLLTIS